MDNETLIKTFLFAILPIAALVVNTETCDTLLKIGTHSSNKELAMLCY
uniref:Uncharacterized protein n=1 Tax=Anguilla anguilla TaxID=7936 RepID=A0A0E9UBX6_ANGAN